MFPNNPYIIAEACNNFNNDFDEAKSYIKLAHDAGCDAIKFQMRLQPDRLTPKQHRQLQDICKEIGIEYLCTPFSFPAITILEGMEVKYMKIGSAEAMNDEFVLRVCETGIPVIVSTGGMSLEQIDGLAALLNVYAKDKFVLMHTTSMYPTPYENVNLFGLCQLSRYTDYVGLSDHTPTIYTALAAVPLGAKVIEKHITRNKYQPGPDQLSSIDADELFELVRGCRAINLAMGFRSDPYPEELVKLGAYRA